MLTLTHLFFAVALVVGVLVTIAVWSPRTVLVKGIAFGVGLLVLPIGYLALSWLLGLPKPVGLEWYQKQEEATLLASVLREGEGIDVWLQLDGEVVPRAYTLVWNRELAEAIQQAEQEAEESGTGVRLRLPFERSWEDRDSPQAYALPQPALPPKDMTDPPPEKYQRPDGQDT